VKAEVPESERTAQPSTTPDNQSVVEEEGSASSQDETLLASTASVTSSNAKPSKEEQDPLKSSSKSDNLVGKVSSVRLSMRHFLLIVVKDYESHHY